MNTVMLDSAQRMPLRRPFVSLPVVVVSVGGSEVTVHGNARTVLEGLHVRLTNEATARRVALEWGAFLRIPPVWKARRPRGHAVAWAGGYLAMRQACRAAPGRAQEVDVRALPCRYALGFWERASFEFGAQAFLTALRSAMPLERAS